jgi:hypothetical protein
MVGIDSLLTKFNKPLEPELPEIASVPQHLHDLFAEAFAQVNKSQSKSKKTVRKKKGFQGEILLFLNLHSSASN